MIRYFTQTTRGTYTRLFLICHCGKRNTPSHGANDCKEKLKDRKSLVKKIENVFKRNNLQTKSNNLYDYLHAIFYNIDKVNPKDRRTLTETMKKTIITLLIEETSKCCLNTIEETYQLKKLKRKLE